MNAYTLKRTDVRWKKMQKPSRGHISERNLAHTHAGLHIKDVVSVLAVKMAATLQRTKKKRKRDSEKEGTGALMATERKEEREKIPQHFGFSSTSV